MKGRGKLEARQLKRRNSYPPVGVRHDRTTGLPLDSHLTHDLMRTIFRHPLLASDGHRYEAETLLQILQKNGKSPYDRNHTFTHFTYDKMLKNNLDTFYSDHKDRCEDYDVEPVLKQIRNWIIKWKDKSDRAHGDAIEEDTDAPYPNTFLRAFAYREVDRNPFYYPPVWFWSRHLNNPTVNLTTNMFIVSEFASFFVALSRFFDSDNIVSTVGCSALSSFFVSAIFSVLIGSIDAPGDRFAEMVDDIAPVLRL